MRSPIFAVVGVALSLAGCGEESVSDGEVGSAQAQLLEDNGVKVFNGMRLDNGTRLDNGVLLSGSLNFAVGVNAAQGFDLRSTATLDGKVGPYIDVRAGTPLKQWMDADPVMRTKIVRYLLECALPKGRSARLKHNGVTTSYVGAAGLGPNLQVGSLSVTEQELVSACLLARHNIQAGAVPINIFGAASTINSATDTELDTYSLREATFVGNLFVTPPKAYLVPHAHYNDGIEWKMLRSCINNASGVMTCGVMAKVAESTTPMTTALIAGNTRKRPYVTSATVGGKVWKNPITVYRRKKLSGYACFSPFICASSACDTDKHACK